MESINDIKAQKECLKKIFKELLIAEYKLNKAKDAVKCINSIDGNTRNSFFVNNEDVTDAQKKLNAITQLINNFKKIAFQNEQHTRSTLDFRTLDAHIKSINKSIDNIGDNKIQKILIDINNGLVALLKSGEQVMNDLSSEEVVPQNGQNNEARYENYDTSDLITSQEQHKILKVHTFDDTWYFTFLAKLFMIINNALGIKTSEEELLETLQKEASNASCSKM